MKDTETDIYFYSRKENEYGFLSNFHRATEIIDGISYQTNEHYYQSQKAKDVSLKRWINSAPKPYDAMKAGRSLRIEDMIINWDTIKTDIMLLGLKAKFGQNKDLANKLINTYPKALHEDSPNDVFWGVKGKDMLGKLLMQVREELIEEKEKLRNKL